MNEKQKIIEKFLYKHELKYSDIWDKSIPSNNFTYHLQKVVSEGLIERSGETYRLTEEGKRFISFLDGTEVMQKPKPIPGVFVIAQNANGDVLFHERKRQPFLGNIGVPGGKAEFGELLIDEAKKELLEETGLTGELSLKVIADMITIDTDSSDVKHHVLGYFYLATNLSGTLITENKECKNFFKKIDDIDMARIFPDLPTIIPKVIHNDAIEFLQAKRYMTGNAFEKVEFI